MPIRIVSFNPNGLKTKGRVASLLQEAKRLAVDVLLVQEHNLDYSCSSGVLYQRAPDWATLRAWATQTRVAVLSSFELRLLS